jgi:hypothetical protein
LRVIAAAAFVLRSFRDRDGESRTRLLLRTVKGFRGISLPAGAVLNDERVVAI